MAATSHEDSRRRDSVTPRRYHAAARADRATDLRARISKIADDGTLVREEVCDKSAKVAHDEQWVNFKVDKQYAPLLKKGVLFSAVSGASQAMHVVAIWPTGKTLALSWVLGAELK